MFAVNIVLLSLAIAWNYADAHVEESITLRVFDPLFKPGDTSIYQKLVHADLERHGYHKEIVNKTTTEHSSESPVYQVIFLFHKKVPCNESGEVESEIDQYVPGLLSGELADKLRVEMKNRNLDQVVTCQVGIEVHFIVDNRRPFSGRTRRAAQGVPKPKHICSGTCIHIVAEMQ